MNWLSHVLGAIIPFGTVLLSAVSVLTAVLQLRSVSKFQKLAEKFDKNLESRIVENHAETLGFNQRPEIDDVEDKP